MLTSHAAPKGRHECFYQASSLAVPGEEAAGRGDVELVDQLEKLGGAFFRLQLRAVSTHFGPDPAGMDDQHSNAFLFQVAGEATHQPVHRRLRHAIGKGIRRSALHRAHLGRQRDDLALGRLDVRQEGVGDHQRCNGVDCQRLGEAFIVHVGSGLALRPADAGVVDQDVDGFGLEPAAHAADLAGIGDVHLDHLDPFGLACGEGVELYPVRRASNAGENLVAPAGISLHERKSDTPVCAGDQYDSHAKFVPVLRLPGQRVGTGVSPR